MSSSGEGVPQRPLPAAAAGKCVPDAQGVKTTTEIPPEEVAELRRLLTEIASRPEDEEPDPTRQPSPPRT